MSYIRKLKITFNSPRNYSSFETNCIIVPLTVCDKEVDKVEKKKHEFVKKYVFREAYLHRYSY